MHRLEQVRARGLPGPFSPVDIFSLHCCFVLKQAVTGCMLERTVDPGALGTPAAASPRCDVVLSNFQQHRVSGLQCFPRQLCFPQFQGRPRLGTCHYPVQGISCSLGTGEPRSLQH